MKSALCGSPAGIGAKCKHIAAIILYINNEDGISKTSLPQQWGIPTDTIQNKYKKGKRINDLFPHKKSKMDAKITDTLEHSDLINRYDILEIPCSLSSMLKVTSLGEVERNISLSLSNIFPLKLNENIFYYKYIYVDNKKRFNIFIETINQSESNYWLENRKYRISASIKAHKIRVYRNSTPNGQIKLVNTFLNENNLGRKGTINVIYGKNTEAVAIDTYKQIFNKEVIKSGLVISHLTPWLCASPDELILKNGKIDAVLEIKCPISCRNKHIIQNGIPNLKYLQIENNVLQLKKSSMYYTQSQILMYCTGLSTR